MLLEISAENFRSFRDALELDLRATASSELEHVVRTPPGLEAASRGALPVIAVFGANASGKTSLFWAADFMRSAVLRSASSTTEGKGVLEKVRTFRFDPVRRHGPVTLRVVFLQSQVRHEYGFVLQPRRSESDRLTCVTSEWLRSWPKGHPRDVFLRGDAVAAAGHEGRLWVSEDGFRGGRRLGADLLEQTRDDVLFVSLASQRNQPQCKAVVSWFSEDLSTSSLGGQWGAGTEALMQGDEHFRRYVTGLLRAADTGIEDISTTRDDAREARVKESFERLAIPVDSSQVPDPRFYRTTTFHRDAAGRQVSLELEQESHGTRRLFELAGPIYEVLRHGRSLWIDELDTGLHHWILRTLVKMFQSPETNPHGAQLIFSTHDAALMDPTLLRRDQIWIVEKDAAEGSQLYSLVDVEDKPRKDQPLFKAFLSGRFGGVPRLDEEAILAWPRDP
jgi:predicted ATPase